MIVSVLPEQLQAVPNIDIVGPVPSSLGLQIDFDGTVLAKSAQPDLAASFLAYLMSSQAQVVWKAGGVAVPIS